MPLEEAHCVLAFSLADHKIGLPKWFPYQLPWPPLNPQCLHCTSLNLLRGSGVWEQQLKSHSCVTAYWCSNIHISFKTCMQNVFAAILLVAVLEYDVSSVLHVSWPTFQLFQQGHTAIVKAPQRFDIPKIVKQSNKLCDVIIFIMAERKHFSGKWGHIKSPFLCTLKTTSEP